MAPRGARQSTSPTCGRTSRRATARRGWRPLRRRPRRRRRSAFVRWPCISSSRTAGAGTRGPGGEPPAPREGVRLAAPGTRHGTAVPSNATLPLSSFTPPVRDWFERSFEAPTPAQEQAWPAIATGEHVLISAPTGSGKTLAAFLWGLDRLSREPAAHTRLVYVSPLKALAYDVDRNLRAPLRGIGADISVAIRTGDTPQRERAAMRRTPPDILITTPESLYLILTSQAREMLRGVESVIVDEIHAVASTKRGAHLALTLERLVRAQRPRPTAHRPQRHAEPAGGGRALHGRAAAHGADRRRRHPQAAGPQDPRAGRVDGRARSVAAAPTSTSPPAARRRASRSGPRSTPSCSSRCARTARRSSSSTAAAAPSASPCASTSCAEEEICAAPTTARWRARSAPWSRRCSRPASCRA